jgi:subtilisin-like proprotein convertase family protein
MRSVFSRWVRLLAARPGAISVTGLCLTLLSVASATGGLALLMATALWPLPLMAMPPDFGDRLPIETHTSNNAYRIPAAGDLDGDGDADAVATLANGNIWWCENPGPAGPWPRRSVGSSAGATTVLVGDINGDGHLDIVVGGGALTVFLNSGDSPPTFSPLPISTRAFDRVALVGSVTGSGEDIVAGSPTLPLVLFTNSGDLTPSFASEEISTPVSALTTGDFDGDGRVDFATGDAAQILWWRDGGAASPRFTSHLVYAWGAGLLGAGDVNGDGAVDLVSDAQGQTALHENNGGSPLTWKFKTIIATRPLKSIYVGDMDGDGDGDVLTYSHLLLNFGDTWSETLMEEDEHHSSSMAVVDFVCSPMIGVDLDGDGFRDILAAYSDSWRYLSGWDWIYGYEMVLFWARNHSDLSIASAEFADISGDGVISPGEPGALVAMIRSDAVPAIEDVAVSAVSGGSLVSIEPGPHMIPSVPGSGEAEVRIPFTTDAGASLGQAISAELTLQWRNQTRPGPPAGGAFGFVSHEQADAQEDPAATIPDNDPAGLTRTLDIDILGGTITAITVDLDIAHPYRGEVFVTLQHPQGATSTVFNHPGEVGADILGTFPVSAFNGLPASGTYTLKIVDSGPGDLGKLNHWALHVQCDALRDTPWRPEQIAAQLTGEAVDPWVVFDLNHDGVVDVADLVWLIGPRP